MLKKFRGRMSGFVSGTKGVGTLGRFAGLACAAVAFVHVFAMNAAMAADVVVPDAGIDWADVATKAGVALGAVIVGLIGIKIMMAIINSATRMLGRMFS